MFDWVLNALLCKGNKREYVKNTFLNDPYETKQKSAWQQGNERSARRTEDYIDIKGGIVLIGGWELFQNYALQWRIHKLSNI